MIKFKRKEFGLGAVAWGTLPVQLAQGKVSQNISNKNDETMSNLQDQQNEILNERSNILQGKQYSSAVGDVAKAAKDSFGKGVVGNVVFGTTMALGAYGFNKLIQHDMKKNNLDIDEYGNMYKKGQRNYTKSDVKKVPNVSDISSLKNKAGKNFMSEYGVKAGLLFGALGEGVPSYMNYTTEKNQLLDQISKTGPTTASFSEISQITKVAKFRPGLSVEPWHTRVSGGLGSFFTIGLGGTKNVQNFGKKLTTSENPGLQKAGNWIRNHKTAANLATFAPLAVVGDASFGMSEKGTKKAIGVVDPGAYKYEKSKDKAVNN